MEKQSVVKKTQKVDFEKKKKKKRSRPRSWVRFEVLQDMAQRMCIR